MDQRDDLIELMAGALMDTGGYDPRVRARAVLSVVETAASICPECGGTGYADGWPDNPNEAAVSKPLIAGAEFPQMQHRCRCGGQPGPLLVLEVLGGEHVREQCVFCEAPTLVEGPHKLPMGNGRYCDGPEGFTALWRFPRRQEGRP